MERPSRSLQAGFRVVPWKNRVLAANAGIGEKDNLIPAEEDLTAKPEEPNMFPTKVNMFAVFYGLKIFVHYCRRTAKASNQQRQQQEQTKAASGVGGPTTLHSKMIITASCSALYPFPDCKQKSWVVLFEPKKDIVMFKISLEPLVQRFPALLDPHRESGDASQA
ncbi:hypothetical protein LTR93_011965 [Exophiala xenobiotica]|nr:hypothetical protein LTR93_011965 [Exophiala xenobiotica]